MAPMCPGQWTMGFPCVLGNGSVLSHKASAGSYRVQKFLAGFYVNFSAGVPVPWELWKFRTQACQNGLGCQFLENDPLYIHGQSGHKAFLINFQDGW